ncbi:hypothetical protein [Spirosoma endophyticum]|uniref:histidine kinase n=1 Tax=Spirosoma endophyticum TaxID=662367 RepID=A0A1I1ZA40_9BACT|nr:hypothetical protein [Spirosoma endophyticum]SFE28565.1 hypothetical protein SAMN05216167_11259 [Spirosoma endophyticum]
MGSLTDDDKAQLGQLADYLVTQQETIVDRWRTNCSLDEALHPFPCRSCQACTETFLVLLHRLIQRIPDESRATDLDDTSRQLCCWQGVYSVAQGFRIVDTLYDVLDEQIQQFIECYPQTPPRVITQVYRHLLQLSQQISSDSSCYVDQCRQTRANEPRESLPLAPETRPQLAIPRVDYLRQSAHDLRSTFGILTSAASLLQKPLKANDRAKYLDMLHRNVNVAKHLLNQLLANAPFEEGANV